VSNIINDSVLFRTNPEILNRIKHVKWKEFKWKGLTLMKDPMTLSIYQQLFNDIRPKTIIEFGSYEGGSALWMSDICQALGIDTKILTFDIDAENYKCSSSLVEFEQLDSNNINEYIEKNFEKFKNLESPIVVIEDCHVNVKGICIAIDKILSAGDYLIIEDTLDFTKHNEMIEFLDLNRQYNIDRHYCDFWGTNYSWNINSFLRKL
jgi:cephalosporin hydroxylase